jgi:AcrR family transcriptional regulator
MRHAVMKSSGQVRQEIIDVAARLFARYGFKKTSIDDVALAARIGKGSVYLHFASKEEIFAEVVGRMSGRMLDALAAAVKRARSPVGKVRAFVEAKLTSVARLAEAQGVQEQAVRELLPAARAYRGTDDVREHALLADVLREGNASGAFTVEDPDRLATGIIACLTALDTSSAVKRDDAAIRSGVDELVAVLVRGLSPIPPCQSN